MRKVWVVVANSGLAKIYLVEDTKTLTEKKSLEHFEAHLKGSDLMSDREGSTHDRHGYFPHPHEEKTSIKTKERHVFADQIVEFLEKHSKEFDRLYLISTPIFLGHLRSAMSSQLIKMIAGEVDKDLTHLSPKEIRDYLPYVL